MIDRDDDATETKDDSTGDGEPDFSEPEDGPAWAQGAAVRWFGVVVFLLLGAFAVLVLIATVLAIYDRARDDTPPPGSVVWEYEPPSPAQ